MTCLKGYDTKFILQSFNSNLNDLSPSSAFIFDLLAFKKQGVVTFELYSSKRLVHALVQVARGYFTRITERDSNAIDSLYNTIIDS